MSETATIERAVDIFISKATRQNDPLQEFWATKDFAKFKMIFASAIRQQGRWVANYIQTVTDPKILPQDGTPMTETQKVYMHQQLERHMPRLKDYIHTDEISPILKKAFEAGVVGAYKRMGITTHLRKGVGDIEVDFKLANTGYLQSIEAQANYLINKSNLDTTTIERMSDLIYNSSVSGETAAQMAGGIRDYFSSNEVRDAEGNLLSNIPDYRADMIARTETSNSLADGNHAAMQENGVQLIRWVCAGDNPCEECLGNEDDGAIKLDESFTSGDTDSPAHPNCECYTESADDQIDPQTMDIWDGSDNAMPEDGVGAMINPDLPQPEHTNTPTEGALEDQLRNAGYRQTANGDWINPQGKPATTGEMQNITETQAARAAEAHVNAGGISVEQADREAFGNQKVGTVFHSDEHTGTAGGGNMELGKATYVARDATTAEQYGGRTYVIDGLNIKESEILKLDDNGLASATQAARDMADKAGKKFNFDTDFPKYVQSQGYKAAEIPAMNPDGTQNVVGVGIGIYNKAAQKTIVNAVKAANK